MVKIAGKEVTDISRIENLRKRKRESNARCKDRIKAYHAVYTKTEKAVSRRKELYIQEYSTPIKRLRKLAYNACARKENSDIDYMYSLAETAPANCKCCNKELDYSVYKGKNNNPNAPSFDRIDNTKSYIKDNVYIICNQCNWAKRDSNIELLQKIIEYIKANLKAP